MVAVRALVSRLHVYVLLTVELGTPALGRLLWLMLVTSLRCKRLLACSSIGRVHLVDHLASTGHPLAEKTSSFARLLLSAALVLFIGEVTDEIEGLLRVPARSYQHLTKLLIRILRTKVPQELDHV